VTDMSAFRYDRFDIGGDTLVCRYALGAFGFVERVTLPGGGDWSSDAARHAARLVWLLAGVSYYKTAAPPVIDLGDEPLTDAERAFLKTYYVEGLGEFAYRNRLDLGGLRIEGPSAPTAAEPPAHHAPPGRALIPFGGGIDSIVTVELLRKQAPAGALFIVSRPGDRFDAIEQPAAIAGLPIVRAEREIDPQVLRSADLGFLNGHVPVTGIISAIAVLAAVVDGRDAVAMSNEWSSSVATVGDVNHQWSKSLAFEGMFRPLVPRGLDYFSRLRPYTELLIARRFADLREYHGAFRSCNRAFHIDQAKRLDHWCGRCDKCCFIDLILAPFMSAADLEAVFAPSLEPLRNAELAEQFRALLGTSNAAKPFECVGDEGECRAAAIEAAERPDRFDTPLLQMLASEARHAGAPARAELLKPIAPHFIPDRYATDDLLV
jgi:hypothetical protein